MEVTQITKTIVDNITKSFVRWEEPPRDYTNDDEETKKHTVYCYCKCPLPSNYAICIDKRVATKDICGFYAFYCPDCKTAGLVFGGASGMVKPTEIFQKDDNEKWTQIK